MMDDLDQLALSQVKPGDVVVDVGAGSGDFTRAAHFIGARVIAIEPSIERCRQLQSLLNVTVIHAGAARDAGRTQYVERVRRTLATNARDAVAVTTVRLDDLIDIHAIRSAAVVRIRAAGNLGNVLSGAVNLVDHATVVRLVGNVLVGDEPTKLLDGRPVLAATIAGIMQWSRHQPYMPAKIDWIIGAEPAQLPVTTEDDLAAVMLAEGRAPDAGRRARIARLLEANPQLFEDPYPLPHAVDLLDELALDPDPATWRAAAWWRDRTASYDDRTRNQRRRAAMERRLDHLTGPHEARPSPFSQLI